MRIDDGFQAVNLTPEEFELEVKAELEATGIGIQSFVAKHREKICGTDGKYEIDVSVRFEALGADFLVLIECKHQKAAIKREIVQILYDRIRSTGAHKGMIFTTAPFQRGALEYAKQHGIALVRMCDGEASYQVRDMGPPIKAPPWANIPPYIGWLTTITGEGCKSCRIVSVRNPEYLREFILG